MEERMVRLEDVSKVYRTDRIETTALDAISVTIEPGAFVSVMGPSGCGKSTLLNVMGLLDAPTGGTVSIDGAPIRGYRDREVASLRNAKVGFVFQSFHLIGDLTVADNVEIPLLYRRMAGGERRQRVAAALDRVGLTARRHHFPTQLSGGQQQRVAIARAIVGEPRLLLADEPTGNLDPSTSVEIMRLLDKVNRIGTTVCMATHDQAIVDAMRRRVIELDRGKVIRDQARGVYS
jgi:putative ABC transport system ATP-binding protein